MKQVTKKTTLSFLIAFFAVLIFSSLNAQETQFRDQAWRFGVNAGLQFNSVSLGWQNLEHPYPAFSSSEVKKDNSDGKGLGFYGGIFGEYLSSSWWGIQLRVSYDMRNSLIKDTTTINVPDGSGSTATRKAGAEYNSRMDYLSWELLFRIDQKLIPNLNIYFGPIIAINIHGSYDYTNKEPGVPVKSGVKLDNRNDAPYGLSGGLAYDIEFSRSGNTSYFLTPFAEASWIVNQKKTDYYHQQNSVTDVWSTLSLRLGVRASLEFRNPKEQKVTEVIFYREPPPKPVVVAAVQEGNKVSFSSPYNNTITTKNVNGYFPIHPYVFFEKGHKEIPARYTKLSKENANNFKETDLENFRKGDMTVKETNVNQLMVTYYNVMNITATG